VLFSLDFGLFGLLPSGTKAQGKTKGHPPRLSVVGAFHRSPHPLPRGVFSVSLAC